MSITNEDMDRYQKIIDQVADQLGEHFENVAIFANSHQGKEIGTIAVKAFRGNIFAVQGQVENWAKRPLSFIDDREDDE